MTPCPTCSRPDRGRSVYHAGACPREPVYIWGVDWSRGPDWTGRTLLDIARCAAVPGLADQIAKVQNLLYAEAAAERELHEMLEKMTGGGR